MAGCSRRDATESRAEDHSSERAPVRFGLRPPRKSPVQPLGQVEAPELEGDDGEDVQLPPPSLADKKPPTLPQPRLSETKPERAESPVALHSEPPKTSVGQAATRQHQAARPETAATLERKKANYARRYWKMDANKDGVVSEAERTTTFDWMLTNREKFRARVDRDQNGSVSDAERKAAFERFRVRPPRGAKTPPP